MEIDVVPAEGASDSLVDAWWFRFLVRSALALLALLSLWSAADRYQAFRLKSAADFQLNLRLWGSSMAALVATGFLFGLATWLPLTRVRLLPSRLLLAAVALLPLAQFWWVLAVAPNRGADGWLAQLRWFDGVEVQFVFAVLAGVAIASGFRAKRPRATRE